MQARYYDPVIGRFYSNDPVDVMGHITRGNPIHGFNRYTYANNNPYKYVDPDGKFGLIGFAIGFIADSAIQLATSDNYSLSQALVSGTAGIVTGGMGSLVKSSFSVGVSVTERVAAAGLVSSSGAVTAAGASLINDDIKGTDTSQRFDNAANAAIGSVVGIPKVVANKLGSIVKGVGEMFGKGDDAVVDAVSKSVSTSTNKSINEQMKDDTNK